MGALLLKSSHKHDNARPEPVGGINQGFFSEPGVPHLLHDYFQLLIFRIMSLSVFSGLSGVSAFETVLAG